jgi:hypothetical protein
MLEGIFCFAQWECGLYRGPLSLVSTIEDLLGRKSSDAGLEYREYSLRDPSRWPRCTLYPLKLALTSPISCGRSVGIVRSRTQATEFNFYLFKECRLYRLTNFFLGGEEMRVCGQKPFSGGRMEWFTAEERKKGTVHHYLPMLRVEVPAANEGSKVKRKFCYAILETKEV